VRQPDIIKDKKKCGSAGCIPALQRSFISLSRNFSLSGIEELCNEVHRWVFFVAGRERGIQPEQRK
jgi:hypothetical protein